MPELSAAALIAGLEARGIVLFLGAGELRYRSPRNALTEADKALLRGCRDRIRDFLTARMAARGLRTALPKPGPLIVSVAQEMWRQFAGGTDEGKPIALNIGMVGTFRNTSAEAVTAAIREVITRHDALRVSFREEDGVLTPWLNDAEGLQIEQADLRGMNIEAADAMALAGAQEFCARLHAIESGGWLTRAKVFALPGRAAMGVISSAHMIADAGTRNIVLDALRDIVEEGAPQAPSCVPYNDYAIAEREFLAGPQGAALIEHWRGWYHDQPTMHAPDGTPLAWGNGLRSVRNFAVPRRVLDRVRALAANLKVTPFHIQLAIFAIAMARWSKLERFPVRVLGDKRTAMELSGTAGLMFCADAVQMLVPAGADFETVLRGMMVEYDAALARRIPSLHFWAPHCVRPGIEAPDYPNRIPAVFNYYSVGTAREKAEKQAAPDATMVLPWPPEQIRIPDAFWPRRSSPLFLHLMDYGSDGAGSLHFFGVSEGDQESFIAALFQTFGEVVPV